LHQIEATNEIDGKQKELYSTEMQNTTIQWRKGQSNIRYKICYLHTAHAPEIPLTIVPEP
jgi:hypothetical protein